MRKRGQIATILTLAIALIFLFIVMTINIGKVVQKKTVIDNACDGAGLLFASSLGSMANAIRQEMGLTGGSSENTSTNQQFIQGAAMVAGGIILAACTFGTSAPLSAAAIVGGLSIAGASIATGGYMLAAQASQVQALQNQTAVKNLTPEQGAVEAAIQYALFSTVDDPNWVPDLYDADRDGRKVAKVKEEDVKVWLTNPIKLLVGNQAVPVTNGQITKEVTLWGPPVSGLNGQIEVAAPPDVITSLSVNVPAGYTIKVYLESGTLSRTLSGPTEVGVPSGTVLLIENGQVKASEIPFTYIDHSDEDGDGNTDETKTGTMRIEPTVTVPITNGRLANNQRAAFDQTITISDGVQRPQVNGPIKEVVTASGQITVNGQTVTITKGQIVPLVYGQIPIANGQIISSLTDGQLVSIKDGQLALNEPLDRIPRLNHWYTQRLSSLPSNGALAEEFYHYLFNPDSGQFKVITDENGQAAGVYLLAGRPRTSPNWVSANSFVGSQMIYLNDDLGDTYGKFAFADNTSPHYEVYSQTAEEGRLEVALKDIYNFDRDVRINGDNASNLPFESWMLGFYNEGVTTDWYDKLGSVLLAVRDRDPYGLSPNEWEHNWIYQLETKGGQLAGLKHFILGAAIDQIVWGSHIAPTTSEVENWRREYVDHVIKGIVMEDDGSHDVLDFSEIFRLKELGWSHERTYGTDNFHDIIIHYVTYEVIASQLHSIMNPYISEIHTIVDDIFNKYIPCLEQFCASIDGLRDKIREIAFKIQDQNNKPSRYEAIYVWGDPESSLHMVYVGVEPVSPDPFKLPLPFTDIGYWQRTNTVQNQRGKFKIIVARYDEDLAKSGPLSNFWQFKFRKNPQNTQPDLATLRTVAEQFDMGLNAGENCYYVNYWDIDGDNDPYEEMNFMQSRGYKCQLDPIYNQVGASRREDLVYLALTKGIVSSIRMNYGPGHTYERGERGEAVERNREIYIEKRYINPVGTWDGTKWIWSWTEIAPGS